MFTDEMTVFVLEFCECDACLSNVCPRHNCHNCHIHSFLLWILVIIIVYKGNMKVLTFKSTLFLSYRYASHSANCLIRYKRYENVNVTLDRHVGQTHLTDTKSGTQYRAMTLMWMLKCAEWISIVKKMLPKECLTGSSRFLNDKITKCHIIKSVKRTQIMNVF